MNDTPSSLRIQIGFFGCRNAGKSSLVNEMTGQELSVVSRVKGTTTDPVRKSMELLPIGPVVLIDTPGFDDEGGLGSKRIQKTKQILAQVDLAVLVIDAAAGWREADRQLMALMEERNLPCLVVYNKTDLIGEKILKTGQRLEGDGTCKGTQNGVCRSPKSGGKLEAGRSCQEVQNGVCNNLETGQKSEADAAEPLVVSAVTGQGITEMKERLAQLCPKEEPKKLIRDLLFPGAQVVLVCPIDEAAPKGRLILPQQQVIRDILDGDGTAIVTKETGLADTLQRLAEPPAMVVTDSQVFGIVNRIVPESVLLTSFSILMARYKGFLETAVQGVSAIRHLKAGDRILLVEGCTHHRQCNDIGTVKIPKWLQESTGCELEIHTCSGRSFPEDLCSYQLVIHCGGCMLTEQMVQQRMYCAIRQHVPFTNYGIAIAAMTGSLKRSVRMFPQVYRLLGEMDGKEGI